MSNPTSEIIFEAIEGTHTTRPDAMLRNLISIKHGDLTVPVVEIGVVTSPGDAGDPVRLQRLRRLTEIAMADLRAPGRIRAPLLLCNDADLRFAIDFLAALAPVRDAFDAPLEEVQDVARLVANALVTRARATS